MRYAVVIKFIWFLFLVQLSFQISPSDTFAGNKVSKRIVESGPPPTSEWVFNVFRLRLNDLVFDCQGRQGKITEINGNDITVMGPSGTEIHSGYVLYKPTFSNPLYNGAENACNFDILGQGYDSSYLVRDIESGVVRSLSHNKINMLVGAPESVYLFGSDQPWLLKASFYEYDVWSNRAQVTYRFPDRCH